MAKDKETGTGIPVEFKLGSLRESLTGILRNSFHRTCEFQAQGNQAREKCREEFRSREREEDNIMRILVDSQIADVISNMLRPVSSTDDAVSYQIGISASFVRTHFIICDLILNGDLIEAVTLIRKQLESLARLYELDKRPLEKLYGRTPNIGILFRQGGGEIYGHLSEVAHFSRSRVSDLMRIIQEGKQTDPCILPGFSEHSFACLDMHHFIAIYFIVWITEKLSDWYPDVDLQERRKLLKRTVAYPEEIGIIRFPPESERQEILRKIRADENIRA